MFTTTVQSTLDYLAVAIEDDGSNKESLTTEQFGHLLATIPHLSDSSADGTKAIAMLKVPGLPFSEQQLKELRGCLASVSKPRGNNSGPSASAAKKTVLTTKTQEHRYVHEYLPESAWKLLLAEGCTIDAMIDIVTDLFLKIGLLYPTETPTQKWTIALLYAIQNRPFSNNDAYRSVQQLRNTLHAKRRLPVPGRPPHLAEYPESAQAFAAAHPRAYADDDPPVPTKIEIERIRSALVHVSSRGTNKLVRDNVLRVASPQQQSNGGLGTGHMALDQTFFQNMFLALRSALVDQTGSRGQPDIRINAERPSKRRMLAFGSQSDSSRSTDSLADGSPHSTPGRDGAAEVMSLPDDSPVEDEPPQQPPKFAGGAASLDEMLDELKGHASAVKAAKAAAAKAAVQKKPSAAAKFGGHVRPDAAKFYDRASPPAIPPQGQPHPPMVFVGCRIIVAWKKEYWRVVSPCGVETRFPFGECPPKEWANVLKFCRANGDGH